MKPYLNKNTRHTVLLLQFVLLCLVLPSCIKEFKPEVEKYESLLAVEGVITDKPGPYTVKLSISGNIMQKPKLLPYSKCRVEISDNVGSSEVLTEVAEGVYKTDSLGGIQGVVGRKYKINITTPSGEIYESQEEVLKAGVPIDSVYAIHEKHDGKDGYQFYLDANKAGTDTSYLLWSLERTYKFHTSYYIHFYYDEGGSIKKFPKYDSLRTCFRTEKITEIFTLNTAEQITPQVKGFPFVFEDTHSDPITVRYSLYTIQYILNKRAYTFWNSIKKMKKEQGDLFSKQPFPVKGNIINITNPNKPALGYFMAAGISEKRIFVDPLPYELYSYKECTYNPIFVGSEFILYRVLQASQEQPLPIYIAPSKENPFTGEIVWGVIAGKEIDRECVDCRETGYLKKPNFWVD